MYACLATYDWVHVYVPICFALQPCVTVPLATKGLTRALRPWSPVPKLYHGGSTLRRHPRTRCLKVSISPQSYLAEHVCLSSLHMGTRICTLLFRPAAFVSVPHAAKGLTRAVPDG